MASLFSKISIIYNKLETGNDVTTSISSYIFALILPIIGLRLIYDFDICDSCAYVAYHRRMSKF
jgi:hypothetical protein